MFVPWAWGCNGFFTVVGSIVGSILGMAFGFTTVLAISAACYVVAFFAMSISNRSLRVTDPIALAQSGRSPSESPARTV